MREGWVYRTLREVCESDLGKTLNSSKDTGELRPYLCAINILWDKIEQGKLDEIQYDLTDDNAELFLTEDGQMQPIKTITITNNGRTAKYELLDDTYVGPYLTPYNQPYTFTSLAGEEGYQWLFILFVLGKKL